MYITHSSASLDPGHREKLIGNSLKLKWNSVANEKFTLELHTTNHADSVIK